MRRSEVGRSALGNPGRRRGAVTCMRRLHTRASSSPALRAEMGPPAAIGILAVSTILGHVIFMGQQSRLRWHTRIDLAILLGTQTPIAHARRRLPVMARRRNNGADVVERRQHRHGRGVAPQNLIEEMRFAVTLARVAAEDITAVETVVTEAQARMIAVVPGIDWAQRGAERLTPPSPPAANGGN